MFYFLDPVVLTRLIMVPIYSTVTLSSLCKFFNSTCQPPSSDILSPLSNILTVLWDEGLASILNLICSSCNNFPNFRSVSLLLKTDEFTGVPDNCLSKTFNVAFDTEKSKLSWHALFIACL